MYLMLRVESKLGIVAMLNEECVRPKGSNQSLGCTGEHHKCVPIAGSVAC